MLPKFLRENRIYKWKAYVVFCCQRFLGNFKRFVEFSNFYNFFFCKFRIAIFLTLERYDSFFKSHVSHIVRMGSKKEMAGPNTFGIVAFVAHAHSLWDFTFKNFPGKSMHPYYFLGFIGSTSNSDASISPFSRASHPIPASRRFINMLKESYFWRNCSFVVSHGVNIL